MMPDTMATGRCLGLVRMSVSGIHRDAHGLLADFEQLDIEDEHAGGSSLGWVFAVGEVRGDPEPAFLANHHQLHALGPAGDHAIEREGNRFAAGDRAVEQFAIGGPAGIMHGE